MFPGPGRWGVGQYPRPYHQHAPCSPALIHPC